MMKKLPFFLLMFAMTSFTFAQTIVFSDNFDTYTVGSYLAESNPEWTTWNVAPGTAEDGVISNAQAASAPNSLYVSGSTDQVYLFNDKTEGHYQIAFNIFVPENCGGYFNVQQVMNEKWSTECYFFATGKGHMQVGGITHFFNYPMNAWCPVVFDVDLDHDLASLTIYDTLVFTWPYHYAQYDSLNGENKLACIDFYAFLFAGDIPATYYIDDFVVTDVSGVTVNEYNQIEVSLYPNPATDCIQVVSDEIQRVEIYNMLGTLVFDQSYSNAHVVIPTKDMAPGTYAVAVTTRDTRSVKKVMVR